MIHFPTLLRVSALCLFMTTSASADRESGLRAGTAVWGDEVENCDSSLVQDAVGLICDELPSIIPGFQCVENKHTCRPATQRMFAGTTLRHFLVKTDAWNGRGGAGRAVADGFVCSMRELSNRTDIRKTTVEIGIGTLGAEQHVGFVSFDRTQALMKGYRKIIVDIPLLGRAEAVSQDFSVRRVTDRPRRRGQLAFPFTAGTFSISETTGIEVESTKRYHGLEIRLPSITVDTPIGPVSATPQASYKTNAPVMVSPVSPGVPTKSVDNAPAVEVTEKDVMGTRTLGTETVVPRTDPQKWTGGWRSTFALGSRGAASDMTPNSGGTRPDLDLASPRDATEAGASVAASAGVAFRYPDVTQLLSFFPFLDDIPFLEINQDTLAVEVTPNLSVDIAGQLAFQTEDATAARRVGEFEVAATRQQEFNVATGVGASAGFGIDIAFHLHLNLKFPPPIGYIRLVNIDPHIPIKIFPLGTVTPKWDAGVIANGVSISKANTTTAKFNAALDSLSSPGGIGTTNPAAFIQACFAPSGQPPSVTPEPVHPTPSDRTFDQVVLFPCNVCIGEINVSWDGSANPDWPATDERGVPSPQKGNISKNVGFVMPSVEPATFKCNRVTPRDNAYPICHDLCTLDKRTKELHLAASWRQIADNYDPKFSWRKPPMRFTWTADVKGALQTLCQE